MTALLRSDDTALAAVAALLGPGPAAGEPASGVDGNADGPPAERTYAVLPRRSRPRYLVPVGGRHARGAHIRPGAGATQAAVRLALRGALRAGGGRLVRERLVVDDGTPDRPGLRRHLAALLDRDDIDLAIALGAPRPNRKPVVQAIGADGATVAWVKVGVDAHTDALVAHETEALSAVAGRGPALVTPPVLASGTWQGHPLLALGHIELRESADALALTPAAIRAIAGPTVDEDVVGSAWWRALAEAPDDDGAVAALLAALAPAVAGRRWPFARWHGDLAPWNATWQGDRLAGLGLGALPRPGAPRPRPGPQPGADRRHPRRRARRRGPARRRRGRGRDPRRPRLRRRRRPPRGPAYAVTLRARYAADARHGPLGPGAPLAAGIDADPTLGREAVA